MEEKSHKRLFFALWPPPDVRARLAALPVPAGRRVAPDNLHITLVFLGGVAAGQQTCLEQAADRVRGEPFELHLDETGHWRRPQVWWVGPRKLPAVLRDLVAQLRAAALGCGVPVEDRPYQAHVTLARKVRRAPADLAVAIPWPVGEFVLVQSDTAQEGPRYTVLRSWSLG